MVLGVMASDGKIMPTYFFKPVEKKRAEAYYKVLWYKVLLLLKVNYPNGNCAWNQVLCLMLQKKCKKFCKDNYADFWPATFWSSTSPDLSPLDYAVWVKLEHSTDRTSHPGVDNLNQVFRLEWDKISRDFILNCCNTFKCLCRL